MHMDNYGLDIPMRQPIVEKCRANRKAVTLRRLFCLENLNLAARQRGYSLIRKPFKRKETAYAIHHVTRSGHDQQPMYPV